MNRHEAGVPLVDDNYPFWSPDQENFRFLDEQPVHTGSLGINDLEYGLRMRLVTAEGSREVVFLELYVRNNDEMAWVTTPERFSTFSADDKHARRFPHNNGSSWRINLATAGIVRYPAGWHPTNYAVRA